MQKNLPYILIAFGVSFVFIVLTWLGWYDSIENKLLDYRFLNRGKYKLVNSSLLEKFTRNKIPIVANKI